MTSEPQPNIQGTPASAGVPIKAPGPNKPLTWPEKVEQSNKKMINVPKDLKDKAKEFYERIKQTEILEDELNNFTANFWFEVRKNFREQEVSLPENSQMGLNLEAAKDGEFIINIRAKVGGMPI